MARVTASDSLARRSRPLSFKVLGVESALQARAALWAYAFALPWILGLIFFILGPILASGYLSLTEYDVLSAPSFVGLENYRTALYEDDLFWPSLLRTFEYSIAYVPLELAGSLAIALLLNTRVRANSTFRTLFYLPSLTPAVALALVWSWLMHPQVGPINTVLGYVGIQGPQWLTDKNWALWSLMIITLWNTFGGNPMLIFLAGLQGVPDSLLDAAEIDGAGRWAKFRNVILPMISPTLLFNLILGIIGALKVFTIAFVATNGGPAYSTWFLALHIYNEAFKYFRMGYGSALAWIFVIVLLIFTFIQMQLSKRWVYYAGEAD